MSGDILNINSYLATVIDRIRERVANSRNEQKTGKYKGVDVNNKPLYEIDGKVLRGKFSFNSGQRTGSVVLGDTNEYLAAQAVLKKVKKVPEKVDPKYFTDYFLVSRPDGSAGYIKVRTPRENTVKETNDSVPIIEVVMISVPYNQGGITFKEPNPEVNDKIINGYYHGQWIQRYDSVPVSRLYQENNTLKGTVSLGSEGITTDRSPWTTLYAIHSSNGAAYIGGGFTGSNLERNGYAAIKDDIGTSKGFSSHHDVNIVTYDHYGQYQSMFNQKQHDKIYLIPAIDKLVTGGKHWYIAENLRKDRGYHYLELKLNQSLNDYTKLDFSGFIEGRKIFTNRAAQSDAVNPSLNGFDTGIGGGLWDLSDTYQSYCNGVPSTKNTWTMPSFSNVVASGNIYIGADADYHYQGASGFSQDIYFDRATSGIPSWNPTGLLATTQANLVPPGSNTTFPGCYGGVIADWRVDQDGLGGTYEYFGTQGTDNYQCIVTTLTPTGLVTSYVHSSGFPVNPQLMNIGQELATPGSGQVGGPHDTANSCGQYALIDDLHQEDGFHVQLPAYRWLYYDKYFFRYFFPNFENEVRYLTPSYFGLAYCEIIPPQEYIYPTGWQDAVHAPADPLNPDVKFGDFVKKGWLEDYAPFQGAINANSSYTYEDIKDNLAAEWGRIESGYGIATVLPPMINITHFFAGKRLETKVLAYEENDAYFYPKVAVKLHDQEYWLGCPKNFGYREIYNQTQAAYFAGVDALGNVINVSKPPQIEQYPAIWYDWSEPIPIVFSTLNNFIYSVKETQEYYNPEKPNELVLDQYCEWTTVSAEGDPYNPDYIVRFWYGKLTTFLEDPFGTQGYFDMANQNIYPLWNRRERLFLMKEWNTSKPYHGNFVNDSQFTYEEIVQTVIETGQDFQKIIRRMGNVGMQVQYDIYTDTILAMGYEKSTKKDRHGVTICGIDRKNRVKIVRKADRVGWQDGIGIKETTYSLPLDKIFRTNKVEFLEIDETDPNQNTIKHEMRYCLTAVQEADRGLIARYFDIDTARHLPSGGIWNLKDVTFQIPSQNPQDDRNP